MSLKKKKRKRIINLVLRDYIETLEVEGWE